MFEKAGLFFTITLLAMSGSFAEEQTPASNAFEKELFMLADFDTPFQANGVAEPQLMNEKSFCEGRFGKGYLFQRAGRNLLPDEIASTRKIDNFTGTAENSLNLIDDPDCPGEKMISAKGGVLSLQKVPVKVSYSWVMPKTGLTGSCFIKGPKEAKVTIEIELTPFEGDSKAALEKISKRADGNKSPVVPDKSCPQTIELSGEWQRIAAYAELDNRLTENRKASMSVKMESPTPESQLLFRKFQFEQTHVYPHTYFAPIRWVPGDTSVSSSNIDNNNVDVLEKFPAKAGTISMWIRQLADSNLSDTRGGFFSMTRGWSGGWQLYSGGFSSMSKKGCSFKLPPSQDWMHFAASWDESKTEIYLDGQKIASSERLPNEVSELGKYRLSLGAVQPESLFAEAVMDELAIFKRALSPEEIESLKNRKEPLRSADKDFLLSGFKRQIFFRNEDEATINFDSYVPSATAARISASVNGIALSPLDLKLKKGKTEISIPFNPYLYGIGSFAVNVQGYDSNGKELFKRTENIEIKEQLQRNKFKFMSWGGMGYVPPDYMNKLGINTVLVDWKNMREIKKISSAGLFLNLRVENSGSFYSSKFDLDIIRKEAREKMLPYKGFYNWVMTLTNSEVYGAGILKGLKENQKWIDWATKQLGEAPAFNIAEAPAAVIYPKDRKAPEDGIIDPDISLKTLDWFMNTGMPPYIVNGVNAELAHELSPGNIVWSEPAMSSGMFNNLDMGADWGYEYNPYSVLEYFKHSYARTRTAGKLYMPTVGMAYWPELKAKKKDKSLNVGLTVDDLTIKCWIALGAVPAHSLSFFTVDTWSEGEKNPDGPFVDPGCGEAFGKIAKSQLQPAAMLLRDMPMSQAPVALLLPESTEWTAGYWWGHEHYTKVWRNALGESLMDYDILYDRDITLEKLKHYRALLFPMAGSVLRKNFEVIKEAAASSAVIVDKHCKQEYPNMKILDTRYDFKKRDETLKVVLDYLKPLREELKASLPVWAEGQSGPVLAFGREYGKRFYAVIINNKRTTGNLNQFFTEKWYEPYGAAQKVAVSLKIQDGSTVYDFTSSRKIPYRFENGRALFELDMAPAAGLVLCVYPKEFKKLGIAVAGNFAEGRTASFKVKITDAAKLPPGGRQLLSAKLSDPTGKVRDESDLYVMENGEGEIPVRFMLKEPPGKWQLELKELSSGLTQQYAFTLGTLNGAPKGIPEHSRELENQSSGDMIKEAWGWYEGKTPTWSPEARYAAAGGIAAIPIILVSFLAMRRKGTESSSSIHASRRKKGGKLVSANKKPTNIK